MHADLVRQFDRVNTPLQAVRLWGGDPATLIHVGDGRNIVYRFRHPGGQHCFLRLGHESHRQRTHIEAELEFVLHLDRSGCSVSTPAPSLDGHLIHTLTTPLGAFHAVAFWQVHGLPVKWGDDAENRQVLLERGRTLGQIHRASVAFEPSGPRRYRWEDDLLVSNPKSACPSLWEDEPVRREYEAVMQWITVRSSDAESSGLVHGDPLSSNFLRSGGRSIAFDFDDCCYHFFAFDLAVAISAGRNLPEKFRLPYLKCLLDGYSEVRLLAADAPEQIDHLARLAALNRYATYLQDAATGPAAAIELAKRRQAVLEPVHWALS